MRTPREPVPTSAEVPDRARTVSFHALTTDSAALALAGVAGAGGPPFFAPAFCVCVARLGRLEALTAERASCVPRSRGEIVGAGAVRLCSIATSGGS
jgi:hypothetical protein